jgi:PPOX class probable FMN-dependent enzyme
MDTKTTPPETLRETVADETGLRELYPAPTGLAAKKTLARLDKHCRRFISLAPFIALATGDEAGNLDVSPKGDAPGFVEVADDTTLLIPDRMGNNRVDGLRNIVTNPHVGILFMIPGVDETLRVNGRAHISTAPELLQRFVVNGKAPTTVTVVEVDEAFLHCSKAMKRSKLWADDSRVERRVLPSLGRMIAEQIDDGTTVEAAETRVEESLRTRVY